MQALLQIDPILALALAAAAGLLIGGGTAWAVRGRALAALQTRYHEVLGNWRAAESRLESTERVSGDNEALRNDAAALREKLAAREAAFAEREAAVTKEREALMKLRGELEEKFKSLAHETFKASQKSFLELADEAFKRHKTAAEGDLAARQEKIAGLVKPVEETLKRYESHIAAIEKARNEAYGTLSNELKTVIATQQEVRTETARLVTALRAQPKTRGRWGEQQLQNVMELAGMSEHVDFVTQKTYSDDEDTRLVPDAVIRLPGDASIVVDAKTSLSAYLDAVEAVDEAEREAYLVKHAKEVRAHMKQLAAKSYWESLETTPDFVAMFIPGENFFAAAVERDPDLLEDAIARRVLLVTPTTLIALARAVAFGWQQQSVAENAREINELARELYKRLSTMGEHVGRTGRNLEGAVKAYNAMVGSLERQVLPQARRFRDLKVRGTSEEIADLAPIESEPRALAAAELTSDDGTPTGDAEKDGLEDTADSAGRATAAAE